MEKNNEISPLPQDILDNLQSKLKSILPCSYMYENINIPGYLMLRLTSKENVIIADDLEKILKQVRKEKRFITWLASFHENQVSVVIAITSE